MVTSECSGDLISRCLAFPVAQENRSLLSPHHELGWLTNKRVKRQYWYVCVWAG